MCAKRAYASTESNLSLHSPYWVTVYKLSSRWRLPSYSSLLLYVQFFCMVCYALVKSIVFLYKSEVNFGGNSSVVYCFESGRYTTTSFEKWFGPAHNIMVLFILHKRILQTRMRSHLVGLVVWFWSNPLSTSILHVYEQRKFWRDCADAQARFSLRWSPMWLVP